MDTEKTSIKQLLDKAQRDEEVLAVLLYGSVARQDQTPLSDIDVCVVLKPQTRSFEPYKLSCKRLEYLQHFSFDIQIFQQLPLYVRKRILKEGQILLVKDEALLYEVAFRTAQAFEDFKHIYGQYLDEVALAGS